MATAIDAGLVKFHASLNVSNLQKSIAFYRVLLGSEPAKVKDNYAKFDIAEPPLVLSLIPGKPAASGHLNHAGLRVRTAEELVAIQKRLEMAGMRTEREDGVECCYAKQTKFWVTDPDKGLWEVYVFHEDVAGKTDSMKTAATLRTLLEDAVAPDAEPPAPEPAVWTHRLTDPIPAKLAAGDATLDDVHLNGTINVAPDRPHRGTILADVRRSLRPGGTVHLHGLAADTPASGTLALPGPASVVEHVSSVADLLGELAAAGFVDATITTLSTTPPFVHAGVALREIRVTARKPADASHGVRQRVVYRGPMAQIADDAGHVYRRGAITAVAAGDYDTLSAGPLRDAFLFLGPEPIGVPVAGCCAAVVPQGAASGTDG